MKRAFTVFSLSFLLAPAALMAQSEYEQQVLDILSEVSAFAVEQGYRQTGDKFVSALETQTAEDHYVDLVAGRDYVFVAVCDQDCSDIDLHLFDDDDEMVGSDEQPDDIPVIELNNVSGGRHRLEVGMYACSEEPCYYAVGVYAMAGSGGPQNQQGGGGDAYVEQVLEILEAWSEGVASEGFSATGDEFVGGLGVGESEDQFFTLAGGADYAMLAVCDQDCDDMDMAVYGPGGNMIDEDVEADANPVLEVNGARAGEYRVEIRMYQCSSEPCYYAVGLFKRSRQDAPWVPVEVPLARR